MSPSVVARHVHVRPITLCPSPSFKFCGTEGDAWVPTPPINALNVAPALRYRSPRRICSFLIHSLSVLSGVCFLDFEHGSEPGILMLSWPGIATGNRAGASVPTPALADRMTGCVRWPSPSRVGHLATLAGRRTGVPFAIAVGDVCVSVRFTFDFLWHFYPPIGFPLYSMLSTVDIYFIHFVSLEEREHQIKRHLYIYIHILHIYIYIIFPPVYFFHVTHSKKQCWHSPKH